ncbi:hypothetical protein GGR50DRAFT_435265 [Xylaria sp. CBS 124048]|nr:hypothetical protein GGR50DRAFT_435265 [Xylaria sp. CBS 124048]
MALTAVCKTCEDPLVVEIEVEEDSIAEPQTVPDDLELICGCHFHWQCLLDQSSDVAMSLKCPSCQVPLAENNAGSSSASSSLPTTAGTPILTRYVNEGGIQEGLDILPAIMEEAYLEANPQARPARAYHVMCSEGDVDGIVDLLQDIDGAGQDEETISPTQLLRYQDPLANMKSGLHLAVEGGHEEVVWLLLWVASLLETEAFPGSLRQIALAMGLQRPSMMLADDIRLLKDDRGRTAEVIAAERDGVWTTLLDLNLLRASSS